MSTTPPPPPPIEDLLKQAREGLQTAAESIQPTSDQEKKKKETPNPKAALLRQLAGEVDDIRGRYLAVK